MIAHLFRWIQFIWKQKSFWLKQLWTAGLFNDNNHAVNDIMWPSTISCCCQQQEVLHLSYWLSPPLSAITHFLLDRITETEWVKSHWRIQKVNCILTKKVRKLWIPTAHIFWSSVYINWLPWLGVPICKSCFDWTVTVGQQSRAKIWSFSVYIFSKFIWEAFFFLDIHFGC